MTTSVAHQIPECIVNKIMLQSYHLSPHPTAKLIKDMWNDINYNEDYYIQQYVIKQDGDIEEGMFYEPYSDEDDPDYDEGEWEYHNLAMFEYRHCFNKSIVSPHFKWIMSYGKETDVSDYSMELLWKRHYAFNDYCDKGNFIKVEC